MPDKWGLYTYYDSPDGEDVPKKIMYTTSRSIALSGCIATFDTIFYTQPKSPFPYIHTYWKWMGPAAAIGATYSVVTAVSCSVRKKRDAYNHVIGGFASGSMIGAFRNCYKVGFAYGFLFAFLGGYAYEIITAGDIHRMWPTRLSEMDKLERSSMFGLYTQKITLDPRKRAYLAKKREELYNPNNE